MSLVNMCDRCHKIIDEELDGKWIHELTSNCTKINGNGKGKIRGIEFTIQLCHDCTKDLHAFLNKFNYWKEEK